MAAMIPMQDGDNVKERFHPVWSSAIPLSPTDFGCVIDEINATCKMAYPKWKRILPLWCAPISFLIVCFSGALIAHVFDPLNANWTKEVAVVAVLITMLAIFLGRWLQPRMKRRMVAALRRTP